MSTDTKPPVPYKESDDHVPNPLFQSGVVDTTGTSGDLGGRVENISPLFAQSRADAFQNAVDAIDDPDRRAEEVAVFHDGEDGHPSRSEAEDILRQAAEDAAADPQLANPHDTQAAREASESQDPDKNAPDADADGGFPLHDDDSKAKWVNYAKENGLAADQGLNKADYVAAVKAAKADKDAEDAKGAEGEPGTGDGGGEVNTQE